MEGYTTFNYAFVYNGRNMDNIVLEKAIYRAINKIRKTDRRRPYPENIVKVAATQHGLNEDAVRKHL